ncbi:YifB family Mg chelatase-like AAA ATPase [Alcaligenes endophyticus]|uniref:YifB family Mg chelatase-like AAA ATPase n=1 Tax=Alcaligenes endophyticus TaxID=1929088 RepID=A0ABT8EIS0_9BURK|nr:YifB family Mg chelatase-like AAA ATPase [Alcaligenes endophyticus]MCX5592460.1 YifB family Mg chelatase-like AAA ATPase [Alcaligenes endophyticus]MDN4121185.1 YifB family Mg chelatase-like AAA ATPase [Alcaligenes endophyticus]
MSLAVLYSCGLQGMHAHEVRVEVHIASGLPAFNVVGLPDAGIRESRERVRSALLCAGYEFPAARITVNLAPADLPKDSGRFDLPIALGLLLASGQLIAYDAGGKPQALQGLSEFVLVGELSLSGAVEPVQAPLLIAAGMLKQWPAKKLILPYVSACLATHVPNLQVLGVQSLRQAAEYLMGQASLPEIIPLPVQPDMASSLCMSDVRGQLFARRALEVAAAGGHSLLMLGTPGVGKTMLAQRLPGLLPDLNAEQTLELAALHSLLSDVLRFTARPPFRSPHHSASVVAIVGGGSRPMPGEISLAHHGVLFMDEFPEFERRALEALREPLEAGVVCIARASGRVEFPAHFQLIAAMNPCPCGWSGHKHRTCRCTPERKQRYQQKISGPILDRIDMQIFLSDTPEQWESAPQGEPSAIIRVRVEKARARQLERQGRLNAALGASGLAVYAQVDAAAEQLLGQAMRRWQWSGRVRHRVLRLARTLADLHESELIQVAHLSEAMSYRQHLGLG